MMQSACNSVFYSSLSFYSIAILLSFFLFLSFVSSTIDGRRGCLLSLLLHCSLITPSHRSSFSLSSQMFLLPVKHPCLPHVLFFFSARQFDSLINPPFCPPPASRCIFGLLQYSFFSCDTFFIYFSSFNLYSYLHFPFMYLLFSLMLSFLFFPSFHFLSVFPLLNHSLCPPFCLLLVCERQIFPLLLFGFFQDLSNLSHVCSFWSTGSFFFTNVLVCKDRKNVSLCVCHFKTTLYLCVYLVEKNHSFFIFIFYFFT